MTKNIFYFELTYLRPFTN